MSERSTRDSYIAVADSQGKLTKLLIAYLAKLRIKSRNQFMKICMKIHD